MTTRRVVVAVVFVVAATAFVGAGQASHRKTAATTSPIPIQAARRARTEFRIFPVAPGTVTCRIPRGGPTRGGTIAGRCSTSLAGTPGHGGASIVTFTERWGNGWRFHHTWRVRVTATSKIVWIRESGNQAPQTWR